MQTVVQPRNKPAPAEERLHLKTTQVRRLWQKLHLFAAKGPAYHAIYGRWQWRRLLHQWRRPATHCSPDQLWAALALEQPALLAVQQAVVANNGSAATTALTRYFQQRQTPQFCFTAADVPTILAQVEREAPSQKAATIRLADEICANRFTFRGVPTVTFADGIDWQYAPAGNVDWRWDLNRHSYFETLGRAYRYSGDERYAEKFRSLLLDWLAANPAGVYQPNWASVFEVAFRINTWLWAFHLFQPSAAFDEATVPALVAGLWQHGIYLETFLEYHAQNNHLLLEAKALAMLGLLFPEFTAASRWRQRGLALFYRELSAQVCADGVHGERATLYHRIITSETVELLTLLAQNQQPAPPGINETFARMIAFERNAARPDGVLPLLGDSALADVHLRFNGAQAGAAFLGAPATTDESITLGETDLWLLGGRTVKPVAMTGATARPRTSCAFPDGGYFVMQGGQPPTARYLLVDCGPFGYQRDATHGHADALSLELYADGQSWLVDPGVYSTHLGWAWRCFFRGSAAHNTVVVDGEDQSLLLDSRRVYRPAQATLQQWHTSATLDFFSGVHDGYSRLAAPVRHQRQIVFVKPFYWVVIDRLTGAGTHCFDLYFHLMSDLNVSLDAASGRLYAINGAGASLQILPLDPAGLQTEIITGATEPIQGWVSLYSGEKRPAPTLRYRREATVPVNFCTVLYPQTVGRASDPVTLTSLSVTLENDNSAETQMTGPARQMLTALTIDNDGCVDYLLVEAESNQERRGRRKRFADYTTDAHLFYRRENKADGRLINQMTLGERKEGV
jgi:uncharacterized heparinase superfamily protein